MKALLGRIWQHITIQRRKQLMVVMVLILMTSLAEIVSIGAIVPFLGVLANPEGVFQHENVQPLIAYAGIDEPQQLLLLFSAAFACAALLSGLMRILLLRFQLRVAHAIGADLSYKIYKRTLYQPYPVHVSRNSSEVIAGVSTKANHVVSSAVQPVITIITSSVMIVMVLLALVAINPVMSISAVVGFGVIYSLFILIARKRLISNSQQISQKQNQIIKSLQEGLGGIRDVLIDGTQATYCAVFRSADLPLRRAVADNLFIGQSPRYVLEAIGIALIVTLAYFLTSTEDGVLGALPQLGALAIGAQRALPMLQQGYGAWTSIRGGQALLQDALALLEQPMPKYAEEQTTGTITFEKSIKLNHLKFRYREDAPWVLKGLDIEIDKGKNIGFIGVTGSGKSTLLDIIMALLHPKNGSLSVDGVHITEENHRGWQSHIAHIPQSIFLSDASIAENIAFGFPIDKINYSLVEKAAKQAQIHDTIKTWENGYATEVGERGVRLSGGQRQRIGIARALYKQADVLILDEATSALDNGTERAVMDAIHYSRPDTTILMVAHRLSTLKGCDIIIELENGKIKRQGTPYEILGNSLNNP